MKKRWLVLFLAGVLMLGGCQNSEEAKKEKLREVFETIGMEYSEVIMNVLSKEWAVMNDDTLYVFTKEGTGEISGEGFTYSCGFDEEYHIALKMIMDDTGEEKYYYVSTDDTGYGLHLDPAGEGEDVYLFQNDVKLIGLSAQQASGVIGEWADKSDNRYILKEDGTMVIKGSERVTEGTFSVVEVKDDGSLLLTLVFGSDTMEFNYEFLSDGSMQLCRPGTDTVHTWIRKE